MKVGDKVKFKYKDALKMNGRIGTIYKIDPTLHYHYEVKYNGFIWPCHKNELELITVIQDWMQEKI